MLFAIVLFVHLVGVAMLFAACGLAITTLGKVHRARETAALRAALADRTAIAGLFPLATVILIGSGIAMVVLAGMDWRAAWLVVAAAMVIVLSLIGALVTGRKMQALETMASRSSSVLVDAAADAARHDVALNVAGYATTTGAVAILFLMSNKPSWPGALIAAGIAALVSVVLGAYAARRGAGAADQRIVA
jgi:hypothetical protein